MKKSVNKTAKRCCVQENKRLTKRLEFCDSYSRNGEERHKCYRNAAKQSGLKAKRCMIDAS